MAEVIELIRETIANGEKRVIANHNLHSLYLYYQRPQVRDFFKKAAWTHIDGMAMVVLARLYGHKIRHDQRVTYVDLTAPLMQSAIENEWRIFYVGSKPGVAERGASRLRQTYPGLRIRSTNGYFGSDRLSAENHSIIKAIQDYKPNILMVGMGMPRQELWIDEHLAQISANVILPVGATIDYVAGIVPTPPRWSGRLCLEWAFRFAAEPKRLWRRYLIEPILVLKLMLWGWAHQFGKTVTHETSLEVKEQ